MSLIGLDPTSGPLPASEQGPAVRKPSLDGAVVGVVSNGLGESDKVLRAVYRELVDAGLMIPLHTFALGRDSAYRLTEAACDMRDGITVPSSPAPSAGAVPARRG